MTLPNKLLDRFSVLLLDMNGTFMFGEDRFGPDEDFNATYRALGGTALGSDQVRESIRGCYEGMLNTCRSAQNFDNFPSLSEGLRSYTSVPESEIPLMESVFAAHERGTVPPAYASLLCRLSQTHKLGLVTNIWARKEPWLCEFDRSGISHVFACKVFSSDFRSIKPSKALFQCALQSFPHDTHILLVGDSLDRDIEPAKALGLATAWINPRGGESLCADYVLPSLLTITGFLAEPEEP
jgi:putative hydrolase of the HAD superfamily/5'-nucleotidase